MFIITYKSYHIRNGRTIDCRAYKSEFEAFQHMQAFITDEAHNMGGIKCAAWIVEKENTTVTVADDPFENVWDYHVIDVRKVQTF